MLSVKKILSDIESGRRTALDCLAESASAIAEKDAEIGAFECRAPLPTENPEGPLAGLAIGVKDIYDTYDMPTCQGSSVYAGWQPAADAALVAMARQKGGWVAGKTVTTEFAFLEPARTKNPVNTAHTPGGSSSGSAAAVAAGMVPAAFGSQTGGSVIRPAAFCGISGFKPSFRLAPSVGMKTFAWSLDTPGFFAASAADMTELVARLLERPLTFETGPGLRIGIYRSGDWDQVSPDMQDAVQNAVRMAEKAGALIGDCAEPESLAKARSLHGVVQNHEAARALGHELRLHRSQISQTLLAALDAGAAVSAADYDAARSAARIARKAATGLFADFDVLLAPSALGAAPAGLGSTGSPLVNKLWTLCGNPCVSVPGLKGANGMPLGVQIIARFGRDSLALAAAAWLEDRLKG